MTFRFAKLVAVAAFATAFALPAHAQSTSSAASQWRPSPLTLFTLLQDGYKIVAVVNDAQSGGVAIAGETFYLQRDQSAFKCIESRAAKGITPGATGAPLACLELVAPYVQSDSTKQ